jgi:hypothetical protein
MYNIPGLPTLTAELEGEEVTERITSPVKPQTAECAWIQGQAENTAPIWANSHLTPIKLLRIDTDTGMQKQEATTSHHLTPRRSLVTRVSTSPLPTPFLVPISLLASCYAKEKKNVDSTQTF